MFVLIAAALAAAVHSAPAGTAPPPCGDVAFVDTAVTTGFQRLDRLPPAKEYLTVYRHIGGCLAPVVVRYDVGVPPR